mmetsp:Transcript_12552/g.26417  ORF Transcript_12552/g.26417 Transcript_12552/m.26417 type:complete len:93 (+) Transcript_12552:152-430(+)
MAPTVAVAAERKSKQPPPPRQRRLRRQGTARSPRLQPSLQQQEIKSKQAPPRQRRLRRRQLTPRCSKEGGKTKGERAHRGGGTLIHNSVDTV